jgi:two-component system, OmpR family, sensor histidine kinase KdpD
MSDEFSYHPALSPPSVETKRASRTKHSFRSLWAGREPAEVRGWRVIPAGLLLVGLLTLAGFWIEPSIQRANLSTLYMLAVIFTALQWGRRAAILSAISGGLLFVYFFVPPTRSFVIGDVSYFITVLGLLAVGLLVSMLTLAAREEAQAARAREAQTAAIYSLTKSLALATEGDLDQRIDAIERLLLDTFKRPMALWMPERDELRARFRSPELAHEENERKAAAWVFENGQEAGRGTDRFSDSRMHFLPLKTSQDVVGVLAIQADSSKPWLPAQERQLLETFANQAALAITRVVLAKEAQRLAVLQEANKLQKALLNSISHNLRTPLASVTGALNCLLEDEPLLGAATQRELLKTAQDEATRLNQLVQNLLDMTRLEGGAVRVRVEPYDVQDVVGAALEQLGQTARERQIRITIPPNLPLVPMDFSLIVQVLVNLLDNAAKYSPADSPIELAAGLEGGQLKVRVADYGTGIPHEHLERVFEKFFRVAMPETPGGVGLGLSICKGFIEAHRGRIWAERRPHGGTEITFCLPLASKQ